MNRCDIPTDDGRRFCGVATDNLWTDAQMTTAACLPVGWDAEPAGRTSIGFGRNWMRSGTPAFLQVRSPGNKTRE
jgi:hypothetical protein